MKSATVERAQEFEAVLRRHGADLSRLRRGHGVIRCVLPAHDDRRASLSVDINRAVFHCFGCGAKGGSLRLRELLGEGAGKWPNQRETDSQRRQREAKRAAERQAEFLPLWIVSDQVRRCRRAAESLRKLATGWGQFNLATWPCLDVAARMELKALSLEAEVDSVLAPGHLE